MLVMLDQPQRLNFVAVVAAAAFAAAFYVAFGFGQPIKNRKRLKGPKGLVNDGTACYMNAVLQAMASCTAVIQWLGHAEEDKTASLKRALLKSLRVINRFEEDSGNEAVSPTYLFSALRSHGFVARTDEQDAHELFQAILAAIENDGAGQGPSLQILSDDDKPKDEDSGIVGKAGALTSPDEVSKPYPWTTPFSGTLTSRVSTRGSDQSSSPTRSTLFNNITLHLPKTTNQVLSSCVSLETLLQMFVSMEAVSCENVKQHTFARLPECLCLHIQRTAFEAGVARKKSDQVVFPSILHMDNFVYARQLCRKRVLRQGATTDTASKTFHVNQSNRYNLCAVIVHLGAIDSGHYVTYRKMTSRGGKIKWFFTSDADVRQVLIEEVLTANPYMLFYEREHIAKPE